MLQASLGPCRACAESGEPEECALLRDWEDLLAFDFEARAISRLKRYADSRRVLAMACAPPGIASPDEADRRSEAADEIRQ